MSSEREKIDDQARAEQGRKINTYSELLEEEHRLRMEYQRDKTRMTEAVNGVMTAMQPASQTLGYVNRMFGVTAKPGIVSHGADIVIDLISKKYLFKGSGWFVTLAGSYVLRAVSQLVLNRKKNAKPLWTKTESKKFLPKDQVGNGHDQSGTAEILNQ